jgi:hypothetical protein
MQGRVYHVNGYYWVFASTASGSTSYFSSADGFTWSSGSTLIANNPNQVSTSVDTKNNYLLLCETPGTGSTITWANWSIGAGTITVGSTKTFTMTGTSLGTAVTFCSVTMATNSTMYVAVLSNSTDNFVHVEVWQNSNPETSSNTWSKVDDVNTSSTSSGGLMMLPLAAGNLGVFYAGSSNLCGFSFNATSGVWSSATCAGAALGGSFPDALAAIGNTVFYAYYSSGNKIINYTLGTGWGSASSLPAGLPSCPCSLSSDNNTNLLAFGQNGTTVLFEQSTNGGSSFGAVQTLVSGLTSATSLDTEAYTQDGVIPVVWRAGSASPYTIQFAATSVVQVTQPVQLTLNEPGYTPATFTISGCAPSPNTVVGDGAVHNITLNGLCSFTISAPANGTNSGYYFPSQTVLSCGSGTCSTLSYTYDRLFRIFAGSYPSSWGSVNFSTQWYVAGTSFGVSETPNAGYYFLAWYPTNASISVSSVASQSATITANAGGTLYALFNYSSTTYPNVFSIDSLSPNYAYTAWIGAAWGFGGGAGTLLTESQIQQWYLPIGQTILPGSAGYANWCADANISSTVYIKSHYAYQTSPGAWMSPQMVNYFLEYQSPFMIQVPLDDYDTECNGWAQDVVNAYPDLMTADYNGTVYNSTVIGSSGFNPVRFDSVNFSYQTYKDLTNLYNNLLVYDPTGTLLSQWVGLHISAEGADHGDVIKPGAVLSCASGGLLHCAEFSNATLYDFYVSPQCQDYNSTLTCASMASAIQSGTYSTPTLANMTINYFSGWSGGGGFGTFLDKSYLIALAYGVYNFTQQYNLGHPFAIVTSYSYSNTFFSNTTYPYPFNTTSVTGLDLLNRFVIPGKIFSDNGNPPSPSLVSNDLAACAGAPLGSANNGVSSSTFPDSLGTGQGAGNLPAYMQNNEYYTPACIGSLLGPTEGNDLGNMTAGSGFSILYNYGVVFNRLMNVGHWSYPTPILSGTSDTSTSVTVVGGFNQPALLWFYTNSTTGDNATLSINSASLGITGSWIAVSLLNWSVLASGSAGQSINLTVSIPAQSWNPVYIIQTAPSGTLLYTNMRVVSSVNGTNPQWVLNGPHMMPIYMIVNSSTQPAAVLSNISGTIPQLASLSAFNSSWVGWQWNGTGWNNMTQYGWYYDSANHLVYILSQVGSPDQITLQSASLQQYYVNITVNPDGSSTPLNSTNYFTVNYQNATVSTNTTLSTSTISITVDQGTSVTVYGNTSQSIASEKWELQQGATNVVFTPSSNSSYIFFFFDDLNTTMSDAIYYGGSPSVNLTRTSAPATAVNNTDSPTQYTVSLSSTTTSAFGERGTTFTVPATIAGGAGEQWVSLPNSSWSAVVGTLIASYYHQYQVSTAVSPSGGGSVSPSLSSTYENATSGLILTAAANSGYTFLNWTSSTGSITFNSSTSNTVNVTVGGTGTITAFFSSNSGPAGGTACRSTTYILGLNPSLTLLVLLPLVVFLGIILVPILLAWKGEGSSVGTPEIVLLLGLILSVAIVLMILGLFLGTSTNISTQIGCS